MSSRGSLIVKSTLMSLTLSSRADGMYSSTAILAFLASTIRRRRIDVRILKWDFTIKATYLQIAIIKHRRTV